MIEYFEKSDTPETLQRKFYATLALGISGRGAEMAALEFDDIKKVVDEDDDGHFHYLVRSNKKKSTTAAVQGFHAGNSSMITAEMEVNCIVRYIDCFPEADRTGKIDR
jgi:hypothetical protein